jgi:hypothetical protein
MFSMFQIARLFILIQLFELLPTRALILTCIRQGLKTYHRDRSFQEGLLSTDLIAVLRSPSVHGSVTRAECDQLAISLVGDPICAVPIQGCFSCPVAAGPEQYSTVQFLAQVSPLSVDTLQLARKIHGQLVAVCTYHMEPLIDHLRCRSR